MSTKRMYLWRASRLERNFRFPWKILKIMRSDGLIHIKCSGSKRLCLQGSIGAGRYGRSSLVQAQMVLTLAIGRIRRFPRNYKLGLLRQVGQNILVQLVWPALFAASVRSYWAIRLAVVNSSLAKVKGAGPMKAHEKP